MMRVAVTRRIFPELIEGLRADFDLVDNQSDVTWSPKELHAVLAEVDGALLTSGERIDEAVLAQAPRLKVVSNVAVGYNNLDLAACTRHGVLATNTPDVLNEAVADHAWALLLAAARRVGESERWLRAGLWKRWVFDMYLGADVSGTTLGILGMGRIGRAIARRAAGFGMRVIFHNRSAVPPDLAEGARGVTLTELLRQSDHLIVVVPYSTAAHHLIDAGALAEMKRTAVLVNIARGGIVDDAALVAALREGRIAAAGLDVYETEPALHPGLLELENVVMTPHIASATRATRQAMAKLAIRNLRAALAGEVPPSLLNPEALDNRRR